MAPESKLSIKQNFKPQPILTDFLEENDKNYNNFGEAELTQTPHII
jgi:hypothetical protein